MLNPQQQKLINQALKISKDLGKHDYISYARKPYYSKEHLEKELDELLKELGVERDEEVKTNRDSSYNFIGGNRVGL